MTVTLDRGRKSASMSEEEDGLVFACCWTGIKVTFSFIVIESLDTVPVAFAILPFRSESDIRAIPEQ